MGLEALVEVVCAYTSDNNGKEKEKNGEDSKSSQRLARWPILGLTVKIGNVHANELEQEVAEGNEIENDDGNHASNRLAAHPPSCEEEKEKRDDEGRSSKSQFDSLCVFDDDKELHSEGQEEEEIKLEYGDVNLGRSVIVYVRNRSAVWCT